MSQTVAINYAHLDEFLQKEGQTDEEVKSWYEKLSEYEIEGTESLAETELLYNGARYLMSFAFTAAEELRDVAEQEAVAMAEKEDQWEEQTSKLKEEIESLRERITSKAEVGDSTEAFRAQIDSLKEENRQLQQSNRDRDREMADQRDRFENLAARVDTLTRERDNLTDQKVHLEDTIRELNRRLSSKTEDTGADWENKKLKLRNEQVLTMSRQMQAVISQNEELREEIDRVSDALEEATRIIEQNTTRYTELSAQLAAIRQENTGLRDENRRLKVTLPEGLMENIPKLVESAEKMLSGEPTDKINFLMQVADVLVPNFINARDYKMLQQQTGQTAATQMKHKLERAEEKIIELQEELAGVVEESNKLKLMIREDRTGEKEAELEHLKKELMAATTLARNLFGQAILDTPGQDPTSALQMRILQLEHSAELLNEKIDSKDQQIAELQATLEKKDEANVEIAGELNLLKDKKIGSAREEMAKLETQLKFRDEQISQLRQHCTLLQVELGSYADKTYESPSRPKTVPKLSPKPIPRQTLPATKETIKKPEETSAQEKIEVEIEEKPSKSTIPPPAITKPKPSFEKQKPLSEIASQAVLISNLYHEIMQLLEDLSHKDELLVEMEKSWKDTKKSNDEVKAQLNMAYDEIRHLKKENSIIEERALNEMKESESMELQRLIESINIGGSELERRMGEATRKLITERMERIRLSRQCAILKTKISRVELAGRRLRDTMRQKETIEQRRITELKYELDTAIIDIGRLQNRVLQSVPIDDYDNLMRKYKKVVKEISGVETNNEQVARQELSVTTQSPREAEIEAKENMLKKMIDVVSDQSEFWSKESGMLQAENEELKKFIEDIENESDLKSVLGAVERRLLDTIRELRENERELLRERKKQRGMDTENTRDSEKLRRERIALLNVINILQRENKMLRDQSMGTVSLQQLELLQKKILDTRHRESEVGFIKSETEKLKEDTEMELLRARALRTAGEVLSSEEYSSSSKNITNSNNNNNEVSRQLQIAYFNSSQQSAKCKSLEKSIHLKERQMAEIREEIDELKQWNMELLRALEDVELLGKRASASPRKNLNGNGQSQKLERDGQVEDQHENKIQNGLLHHHDENDKESDYESDIRSEPSTDRTSNSDHVVVRTIVQDNVEAFEHRIKEIKASAQLALQGYKEQLDSKDIAIARYKQLLSEKIEEGVQVIEKVEIVRQEVEVADKATLQMLKDAQDRVKKLESENKKLKKLESTRKEEKDEEEENLIDVEVQTDNIEHWAAADHPPPSSTRTTNRNNTNEDEIEHEHHKLNSAKSEKVRKLEEEIQLMQELMANRDSQGDENTRQKMEIRDLKGRIQRLTKANKELMITCEQIKEDALAELSTFRRNNDNSDERRMTDLRIEVERLKSVNRSLRLSNEELKGELNKLKVTMEAGNLKKLHNDPAEWERRKKQEELVKSLREKLRKSTNNEKEMIEKLEKRDRMIETYRKDQATRNSEIEKLTKRLKESDPATIKTQINSSWQQRVSELEVFLKRKEEENIAVQKTLTKLRADFESLKTKKSSEISELKLLHSENIQKLKEEHKRSYDELSRKSTSVVKPRPKTITKGSQTEEVPKIILSKVDNEQQESITSRTVIQTSKMKSVKTSEMAVQFASSSKNPDDERTKAEYEELKKLFSLTEQRLLKSQEKLILMEHDYVKLSEKFDRLQIRTNREEKPSGAVLVLSDKLAAKDREIVQLKHQIAHLQRTVNLPI